MSASKTTKKNLVTRIMDFFELEDSAKLDKFFARELKICKRNIKALEINKTTAKTECDNDLEAIKDGLEDAASSLEEAKLSISPEAITSNSNMDVFSRNYWGNITSKKAKVRELEKRIVDIKDALTEVLEDIDSDIKVYTERINIITETK